MPLRQIIVNASEHALPTLLDVAGKNEALSVSVQTDRQRAERVTLQILSGPERRQELLDGLQAMLGKDGDWRITILPVETTIPYPETKEEDEEETQTETRIGGQTREEIYNAVWAQAQTDRNFLVFVALSTVVAGLGMLADNAAVVVGGMVIAPLLGPNLAFAVGVALADWRLMGRAAATNAAGIALALALSLGLGLAWPLGLDAPELLSRADVGFDGIAVALASGAAAALSLVSGLSAALVGVMVAVALLPPTAAMGLFLGAGQTDLALGAGLLLCVNVVCVSLAAQVVMLTRGIRPRTFYEKRKARRASFISAGVWFALLLLLALLLWFRTPLAG